MALTPYSPDPQLLRTTFSYFPSGVVALAAEVEGAREGLVASSFTVGVSMDPPLVLFSVQNTSTTWPVLKRAERIGISVLGETHGQTARQIAAKDKATRFENLELETQRAGRPVRQGFAGVARDEGLRRVPGRRPHADPARGHRPLRRRDVEPLVFHGTAFKQL